MTYDQGWPLDNNVKNITRRLVINFKLKTCAYVILTCHIDQ